MRTLLSYIVIICLALSSLSGSVAYANSASPSMHTEQQKQLPPELTQLHYSLHSEANTACHTMQQVIQQAEHSTMQHALQSTSSLPVSETHDCCLADTACEEMPCDKGCCASHCMVASALLNTNLFNYIPAATVSNEYIVALPNWLFFKDPPPPIIA
ncbi:hypothetical protein [Rheinheimera salexigens]|uniref:hypothetical protein n=1 Tax=Rheinheimera salexigens TaxID=1628148 RepID=UPI00114CA61F|nr:hypothetical protein [Rheinheimera salexigens]